MAFSSDTKPYGLKANSAFAAVRPAPDTVGAGAATHDEDHDDVIADLDVLDAFPKRTDDPRRLVTRDQRQRARAEALDGR